MDVYPIPHFDLEEEWEGPFWENGAEILSSYRPLRIHNSGQKLVIRIDWRHKDTDLIESLKRLLNNIRPEQYRCYSDQGKGRLREDVLKYTLKALGVWSIENARRRVKGQVVSRADVLTRFRYQNEYGVTADLFPNERDFRKSLQRAKDIIKAVEPDLLSFSLLEGKLPTREAAIFQSYKVEFHANRIDFVRLLTENPEPA